MHKQLQLKISSLNYKQNSHHLVRQSRISTLSTRIFKYLLKKKQYTQTVLKTLFIQGTQASEDANRSWLHARTSETSNAG